MNVALLIITLVTAPEGPQPPIVGEPAPPLVVGQWLKGEPVSSFEKGKVYIIDIWAPWCGPCIGGFPHLSELQDRHGKDGLVVIGVTGPDEYGTTLASARKLLQEKEGVARHRMAWDEGGKAYKQWMALESDQGWPFAFVVDREGRIAYVGHPEGIDSVLPSVLSGTQDLDSAARAYAGRVQAKDVGKEMGALYREQKYDEASSKYAQIAALSQGISFEYAPMQLAALYRASRKAEAFTFAHQFAQKNVREARGAVYQMALFLSDPKREGDKGAADVAIALAKLYLEVVPGLSESHALLARSFAARSDYRQAVVHQQRAIELAVGSEKVEAEKLLAEYRRKAG